TVGSEDFQTNLIMPEPCPFLLGSTFPVSIIRPTETQGVAMGAVNGLIADGLFIGQVPQFFELLKDLASDADAARRETDVVPLVSPSGGRYSRQGTALEVSRTRHRTEDGRPLSC
ncbi:MAG TPA: hypothetical protein VJV74_00780, partial [Terriglobia bacterium]|nr:hypothetical protein [Terriglobia bacterium]